MLYSAPLKYLLKVGGEVLTTTAQTLSGAVNELKTALSSLATVATTGSYNDLSDKPTLATVATSGSYNDLSDKPIIPDISTRVAKSGDAMTGALTFDGVANAINFKGQAATHSMVRFKDANDAYGAGVVIGAGGLTVIGGGESADTYAADVGGSSEMLVLANDGAVNVVTNLQNGKSSGKTFTFGADGTLNSPSTIKQNGTAVILEGDSRLTNARTPTAHTHNYAGSSSAGGNANNALKLNGYASDTAKTANTIVRRDGNGYIYAQYYNQASGSETATSSSYVMFCNSDGWLRKTPMSTIKSLVDTNTNTWRGFQFLRRSVSATISKNSNKTVSFSGLNNVSGYAPRIAFFETCTGTGQTWVIPENAAKLCGDGSCSFNCRNFSSSEVTVTVQILVLYTQ